MTRIQDVKERIALFGYITTLEDEVILKFIVEKVVASIKANINCKEVPEALGYAVVDRVCGEFLFVKKQSGQLGDLFDLEVAIKQIQAGDTNVAFAVDSSSTSEQKWDSLIKYLMTNGESDFTCYRKIKW